MTSPWRRLGAWVGRHIDPDMPRLSVVLWLTSVALCVVALLPALATARAFLELASTRLLESYPIQWLEPLFYRFALRSFNGLPIYGPPTTEYVAPIYGPAFATFAGGLFRVFGPGFVAMRLMSFAGFTALCVGAGVWVRRASGSWLWSWVPGLLLIMLNHPINNWFLVTNVDVIYFAFIVAALALIDSSKWSTSVVSAVALCLVLACLFKQNGLVFGVAVCAYALFRDRRAAWRIVWIGAAVLLPIAIVLHLRSEGWFWISTAAIPLESIKDPRADHWKTLMKLSELATWAFALSLTALVVLDRKRGKWVLWVLLQGAAAWVAYRAFAKSGGGENSLLPVLFLGIVLPFVALAKLRSRLSWIWTRQLLDVLTLAGVAFVLMHQPPPPAVAKAQAVSMPSYVAFDRKIAQVVASVDGEVFVGARPSILYAAGRPQNFHQTTLYEGTHRTSRYDLTQVLEEDLAAHRWEKMVLWDYRERAFNQLVATYYRRARSLGRDPLIGLGVAVWVPRSDPSPEPQPAPSAEPQPAPSTLAVPPVFLR
ncbi:MAG: hypothetical protein GXP55_17765 [Deltaproteobacteria bacterium]|nr:hypothetical protein [Deltaproteobacteria bacterium]